MFLFAKKKEVLGIDIGSSSIKVVQLKESKGNFILLNVGIWPLPSEAIVDNTLMDSSAISTVITNLVASLGIKAKEVACSISGNSVIIRKIVLSAMAQEQLEDQISWEAEQYIPFDINDVNMDFQILSPVPQDNSKMNVLLVASKKEVINDYVAVFGEAGLQLSVVDVDSFAVQNAFEINYDTRPLSHIMEMAVFDINLYSNCNNALRDEYITYCKSEGATLYCSKRSNGPILVLPSAVIGFVS